MKLKVTKMHGAANDFVVIDATGGTPVLSEGQWRWLADRHRGVGADQILIVERPTAAQQEAAGPEGLDFVYRIINADGAEVEQCGNGARCFVRFVHDRGLTDKSSIRVLTKGGIISPRLMADGQVQVDMGEPSFDPNALPFSTRGLLPEHRHRAKLWPLALESAGGETFTRLVSLVSMGNPHAVQCVEDVERAPVELEGPLIERHPRFPARVNAGFMQILSRSEIALRVYERGAGETLACGTGACAAVVAGIQQGLLDEEVSVQVRGGTLTVRWAGSHGQPAHVVMTGPAVTVFSTEVEIPAGL
ncbi:MAG: diaminopimelate epimerase [Lautropia sp.]|nr:diaminopimelate epimerase [Lautropia sp.]